MFLWDDDVDEYDSDVEGVLLRVFIGVEDFGDESRDYRFVVVLMFIVSFCVFLVIMSLIESLYGVMGVFWLLVLFLFFNLGDFFG